MKTSIRPLVSDRTSPHPRKNVRLIMLALWPALLLTNEVAAQTMPATPPSSSQEDVALVLSPFVVATEKDTGYAASSTLAGTRLNTSLKDIGSAISIITTEFLADTGTTSVQDLLVYTTSTEVGGVSGNFANGSVTGGRADQDEGRTNPGSNTRIRGLSAANLSRDYFLTDIPMDAYNTSGVTIARGPNSILFGIGSPGGVIENSLKKALTHRNTSEVSFRAGDRASMRATADFNRVLVKDRLALRINALNARTNYQQDPAYERDRRIFLSGTAVLRKNSGDSFLGNTTLRANYESGSTKGVPPNVVPPTDNIYGWFVPIDAAALEAVTGVAIPNNLKPDATWRPQSTRNNLQQSLSSAPFTGTVQRNLLFNQFGVIYENGSRNAGISFVNPAITANAARGSIQYVRATDGRNAMLWAGANNVVDSVYVPGFVGSTLQNTNVFDFVNHLLTGDLSSRTSSSSAKAVTLEQLFFKNKAGVEVTYDRQSYQNYTQLPFGSGRNSDIWVDISEYLSNDQPNPNVGRALMLDNNQRQRRNWSDREAVRATAFYDLDFREKRQSWQRWLGRHVFTGLYSEQTLDKKNTTHVYSWLSNDFDIRENTNGVLTQFPRAVTAIAYISDDLRKVKSYGDVRLNQIDINLPKPGDTYTTWYQDLTTRKLAYGKIKVGEFLSGGDISRQRFSSQAFSWQSYFLKDNLVGLWGWRKDRTKEYSRRGNNVLPDGDYDPANLQLTPVSDLSGVTNTWSLVGHLPVRLPFGSSLSAHYAQSENFSPTGVRHNVFNQLLPADTGKTKEYGVTVSMLQGKLTARANWFQTDNQNVSFPGATSLASTAIGWIDGWMSRYINAENAKIPFAESPAGLAGVGKSYAEFYNILATKLLPPSTAAAENFRVVAADVQRNGIDGLSEVTNAAAKGFEFEVVANPTTSWRISVNAAKQETIQSGSVIALSALAATVEKNLRDLGLWNVVDAPVEPGGSTFGGRWSSVALRPLKAFQVKDGTVSQEQRKWRFNAVSTYRFREGWRKGFLVGGAVRWQDKAAVGYKLLLDANKDQYPDLNSPFYAPAQTNIDWWIGYRRTLSRNIDWSIQLNVRNAFGDDNLIPVITNPDGVVAVARIPQEKNWFITNTFRF
jgi:outer membrane receptor protein involved in Fe transport